MSNITLRHNPYGLIDPFFDNFFTSERNYNNVMKTDVKELEDHYELKVEVPDIKKENIKLSIDDGYLTISATQEENNDEKKKGKFIRRERYYGSYTRSFYVGENVTEADCKAKLEGGVLTLEILKKAPVKEDKKYIAIE